MVWQLAKTVKLKCSRWILSSDLYICSDSFSDVCEDFSVSVKAATAEPLNELVTVEPEAACTG